MKIKVIRFGRVIPHPTVKYSTIKIELEAEVEEDETVLSVYNMLKAKVGILLKEEG